MEESKCVINLATGRYLRGQNRLRESLRLHGDCQFYGYTNESQIRSPQHHSAPYAFKCYAFEQASTNHNHVLWLDASVWAIRSLAPVWEVIKEQGYIMEYAGHMAGNWANDRCLDYFGITRDKAMEIPMYGNAGFLGLNFDFDISRDFLDRWKKAADDGIFYGAWHNNAKTESNDERCKGHRHDMVCGSIIAHQLGMSHTQAGTYLIYASPQDEAGESVVFKAQGI